jgi:hypothetical protein
MLSDPRRAVHELLVEILPIPNRIHRLAHPIYQKNNKRIIGDLNAIIINNGPLNKREHLKK